jgi:hypothetical protein
MLYLLPMSLALIALTSAQFARAASVHGLDSVALDFFVSAPQVERRVVSLSSAELRRQLREVQVHEPHEGKKVKFRALPASDFFRLLGISKLNWKHLTFVCADGYRSTVLRERFEKEQGFVAFERVGQPKFSVKKRGKKKETELAPAYLVWPGSPPGNSDGWPYQIQGVELSELQS